VRRKAGPCAGLGTIGWANRKKSPSAIRPAGLQGPEGRQRFRGLAQSRRTSPHKIKSRVPALRIQRTFHAQARFLHHVSIDLCRRHIFMPEQFLDGAQVVVRFQQVGCETVTQCMAARPGFDTGSLNRLLHRSLNRSLMNMMTPDNMGDGILGQVSRRKDPLPTPGDAGVGVFPIQRVRKHDARNAASPILLEELPDLEEMIVYRVDQSLRKDGHSILESFSVAHGDLVSVGREVLDAQSQAFE